MFPLLTHPFLGASTRSAYEVVEPPSPDDFATLLASEPTARFTIQGAGHSAGPIAHPQEGRVLRSRVPLGDVSVDGDLATLDSRLTWLLVEQALNRRGRSFPVLPDFLHLTVGGTLSVGGVGFGSIEFGAQIDHVRSLRLVTPTGELVECDSTKHTELFSACLAGLGQYGWIRDVTVATIPRRPETEGRIYRTSDLPEFTAMIADLVAFGGSGLLFSGYVSREGAFVEVGLPAGSADWSELGGVLESTGRALVRKRTAGVYSGLVHFEREAWLMKYPDHRYYWTDYVLDFEGMRALLAFHRDSLAGTPLAASLQMINVLAVRRRAPAAPFLLQPFSSEVAGCDFSVGFYHNVPDADADAKANAIEALRALGDRTAELGGRPYLYGLHPSQALLARFKSTERYREARRLKLAVDPHGRFGSGFTFD
jgi:FAD/FMN-containing dehydrogenase